MITMGKHWITGGVVIHTNQATGHTRRQNKKVVALLAVPLMMRTYGILCGISQWGFQHWRNRASEKAFHMSGSIGLPLSPSSVPPETVNMISIMQ